LFRDLDNHGNGQENNFIKHIRRNTLKVAQILKVLMADDDEDDCMFARDAFKESGSLGLMDFVADGVELIEYLLGSGVLPTIILLDLNMPRKNGKQALKEIKSSPAFQNIPVVILTTSRQENDVEFCRRHGASSFLTKPASFREWVDIIKSLADKWPVAE
jgi:CheY-like chemotaxis protein